MSGAGEGEVVSKKVGKEVRGAQGVDRRSYNATSVDVEIDPHCRRLGRSQTDRDFAQNKRDSQVVFEQVEDCSTTVVPWLRL